MASVGHVIIAACGASVAGRGERALRYPWTSAIILSGLSLLPDVDVMGFRFGVEYGDPFGHRGFTHSFAFAIATALVCAVIARAQGTSAVRVFVLVGVVVSSHGLLDMLTDGGLGVALFWPSNERYFLPWRPIPVSPIGRGFLSARGIKIALVEVAYFAPLILAVSWTWVRRRVLMAEGGG